MSHYYSTETTYGRNNAVQIQHQRQEGAHGAYLSAGAVDKANTDAASQWNGIRPTAVWVIGTKVRPMSGWMRIQR